MIRVIDTGGAGPQAEPVLLDCAGAAQPPQVLHIDAGGAAWPPDESMPPTLEDSRMHGDPRLVMTSDGSALWFVEGQPIMDTGLENLALISLFTSEGWCGNKLMSTTIGSGFEAACNQAITRTSLKRIRDAALLALNDDAFGRVSVDVTNPNSSTLRVAILIQPLGSTPQELILQRSGGKWLSQGREPAYPRIPTPPLTTGATPTGPTAQHEDWKFMQFEDGTIMEF